jgi:hypothetical protein
MNLLVVVARRVDTAKAWGNEGEEARSEGHAILLSNQTAIRSLVSTYSKSSPESDQPRAGAIAPQFSTRLMESCTAREKFQTSSGFVCILRGIRNVL